MDNPTSFNNYNANGSMSTSSTSTSSFFQNISWTTWLIIIFICAFLGFNVFAYLAKGTEDITNLFEPILSKLFGTTVAVTSQAIDVSAEGAKTVVNTTANAIDTGLTSIQNITPNSTGGSVKINQPTHAPTLTDYEANEATSSVHSSGKAGWCYIGMDKGFRTCGEIGVNDTCMSGDIFPSQEICMNPNLRA